MSLAKSKSSILMKNLNGTEFHPPMNGFYVNNLPVRKFVDEVIKLGGSWQGPKFENKGVVMDEFEGPGYYMQFENDDEYVTYFPKNGEIHLQ